MLTLDTISLHRFHGQVAFTLLDIDVMTIYISPQVAKEFAAALLKIVNDIDTVEFTDSEEETINIEVTP